MICIIQRVSSALVKTGSYESKIGKGVLVLLGVAANDTKLEVTKLANKISQLRIFEDENQKMNLNLTDIGGEALVVSQFTLLADCKGGRRPSFTNAASPELGKKLYEFFVDEMKRNKVDTKTGVFGAHMKVELINDGPVTIILDSRQL